MKRLFILLILWFCSIFQVSGQVQDSITVYVFLLEDCVISQNYTLTLKKLHEQYAPKGIEFLGVFPNRISKESTIEAFKQTYNLPFNMKYDYFQTLARRMNATVTPEVVVFNHTNQTPLYQGRIDNTYFRVGKRRQLTTTSELADALEEIIHQQPIAVKETPPIGCYILYEAN
ncbi:MAG: redoxin domain-containing protein [Saprospiraceae bacterium]|nr:redoxin domain-containing protein [Saprospiraceae bacterium]